MHYCKNDDLFLKQAGFLSYPVVVVVLVLVIVIVLVLVLVLVLVVVVVVVVDLAAVVSAIMRFCFCCSSSMNASCFPVLVGAPLSSFDPSICVPNSIVVLNSN